jgi:hypothetical protein
MIDQLVVEYIDYATQIKNDQLLGDNVKPQMLLQMAQALSYLVPLSQTAGDQGAQQQMAQEKHAQELRMAQEKHQQDIGMQQQKHDLALQMLKQKAQQAYSNQSQQPKK